MSMVVPTSPKATIWTRAFPARLRCPVEGHGRGLDFRADHVSIYSRSPSPSPQRVDEPFDIVQRVGPMFSSNLTPTSISGMRG